MQLLLMLLAFSLVVTSFDPIVDITGVFCGD